MIPALDTGSLELALRNLAWMGGNLFLAWSAVLFALHLRGTPRQASVAARVLVACVALGTLGRFATHETLAEHPVRSLLVVAAITAAAWWWSVAARSGDRVARVVGIIGVVAFAPNAPYILTDLFHHMQDVRARGVGVQPSVIFALQYAVFLVVGAASWVALVDIGRGWLRERRPTWPRLGLLLGASAVMAFGIFLGRIERWHSWHPLGRPVEFAEHVATALTSVRPLLFTLAWTIAVAATAVGGLAVLDRARGVGLGAWRACRAVAVAAFAALLAAGPFTERAYDALGVASVTVDRGDAAVCLVMSAVAGALALRYVARELRVPSLARWAAVGCLAVPLAGAALSGIAAAQWWSQYRGFCEFVPAEYFDGDACSR